MVLYYKLNRYEDTLSPLHQFYHFLWFDECYFNRVFYELLKFSEHHVSDIQITLNSKSEVAKRTIKLAFLF